MSVQKNTGIPRLAHASSLCPELVYESVPAVMFRLNPTLSTNLLILIK
jgi:hypothetical protein